MSQIQATGSLAPSLGADPRVEVRQQGNYGYDQLVRDYIQVGNTTIIPAAKERITGNEQDGGSIKQSAGLQMQVIHDHNGIPLWWYDPNTGVKTPYHAAVGPPSDGVTAKDFPGTLPVETSTTAQTPTPTVVGPSVIPLPNPEPVRVPAFQSGGIKVELLVPGVGTMPCSFSEIILDFDISMAVLIARPAELGNQVYIPKFEPTEDDVYISFVTEYQGKKFALACSYQGASYVTASGDIHIIFTIAAAEQVN